MKKLLLLFFLFFSVASFAQQGNFFKTYSGIDDISFSHVDTVHDGGYIMTGSQFGPTGGNFIVLKTDSLGNEEWRYVNNEFNNNNLSNNGITVKETIDHNFLVTGTIQMNIINYFDIKVAKLDSTGALIWKRNYDFSYNDQPWELFPESDTTFYIFGRRDTAVYAMKFGKDGDTLFSKRINYNNCFNNIKKVIRDGNSFILAGRSNFNPTNKFLVLQKLDSICNNLWCKQYSDTMNLTNFGDIIRISTSEYTIDCGYTDSLGTPWLQVKKIDSQGLLKSVTKINSSAVGTFRNDSILAITLNSVTHNADSLALGTVNINSTSINYYQTFLTHYCLGPSTIVDQKGIITNAGQQTAGGGYRGYLMRASPPSSLSVFEISNVLSNEVKVFIDTKLKLISFDFSLSLISTGNFSINIIDAKGRLLQSIRDSSSTHLDVSSNGMSAGIYFYYLNDKNGLKKASGKFIIN